jgi:hypothetical protein
MDMQEDLGKSYISLNVTNFDKEVTHLEKICISDNTRMTESHVNEWQEVAMVIDRMFLILFITITLVTTVVFLELMNNG